MKLSSDDYAMALYELIQEKPDRHLKIVKQFLAKLQADRNTRLLPLILTRLEEIEAERANNLIVTVTTASPLTDHMRKEIKAMLKKQTNAGSVKLHEVTDESLIGGIKIRLGDTVIDHSIRTKLSKLAEGL